ncbi:MAG: peptidoglycan binding domain-containing protein [Lachnospiraceae bacterium]|nr:peptidoglycan binding domain-containing protein [Lachnospiraceae bacterium]
MDNLTKENINPEDELNNKVSDNNSDDDSKDKALKEKVMTEIIDEINEKKSQNEEEALENVDSSKNESEVNEDSSKNESIEEVNEDSSSETETISLIPFVDPSVEAYKNKKKRHKKAGIIALFAIVLVYCAGVIYCSNFFIGKTNLNGHDISYKSVKNVDELIQAEADAYTLTADFRDGSVTLKPADIGANAKLTKSIKDIKSKQNPFLWFVYFFEDSNYQVGYELVYDEKALDSYLDNLKYLDRSNMVEPQNAYVRLEDGEAKLIDETEGTVLDQERVKAAFKEAIDDYSQNVDIDKEGCYEIANITSDSEPIRQTLKRAEDFLDIKAQYDFGGYIYQIPKDELTKMAYIDSTGNVKISETNVKLYAEKFAEEFTTYHKDREFYTHDNKHILISGGYYGWQIDAEAEGDELYEEILKQRDFVKAPACIVEGYTLSDINDIGDNYVEIDLTDQHVYIIRDGKVVYDSLCVSGNESRGMGTPGGVYPITYTQRNATLRGPGYATPVAYWMPFNGGIGMHDATWKSKFGEDYYKYDGSHGCINLPLDAAGEIFELVEKGMPVVCYWEDEITYLN